MTQTKLWLNVTGKFLGKAIMHWGKRDRKYTIKDCLPP